MRLEYYRSKHYNAFTTVSQSKMKSGAQAVLECQIPHTKTKQRYRSDRTDKILISNKLTIILTVLKWCTFCCT